MSAYRREPKMSPNVKEEKEHVSSDELTKYVEWIEADDKATRTKGFKAVAQLFAHITSDDETVVELNQQRFTETVHNTVVSQATKSLKGSFPDEQEQALRAATSCVVFGYPTLELEAEWIATVATLLAAETAAEFTPEVVDGLVQALYLCATVQMMRLKDAKERSVSAKPLIETLQAETCGAESSAALMLGASLFAKLEEIDDLVGLLEAGMDQVNSEVLMTVITAIGVVYERFGKDTTLSSRIFSRFESQSAKVMGKHSAHDIRTTIQTVADVMDGVAEMPSYDFEIALTPHECITVSITGFELVETLKAVRTFAGDQLEDMLQHHRFVRKLLKQENLATAIDPLVSMHHSADGAAEEREKKRLAKEQGKGIDRARRSKEHDREDA